MFSEDEIEMVKLGQAVKPWESERTMLRADIQNLKKQQSTQELKVEEARQEELDRDVPLLLRRITLQEQACRRDKEPD
jgi:hypothetical protein